MHKGILFGLVSLSFLGWCVGLSQQTTSLLPQAEIKSCVELRPGVYVANEISTLPLPTSGYDVYVIGEVHAMCESQQFLLDYLKILYEVAGVRDVMLENNWLWGEDAENYVQGRSDGKGFWHSLDCVVLDGIRAWNEGLPEDERVHVHMIDIISIGRTGKASFLSTLHDYLRTVLERLGEEAKDIEIPLTSYHFHTWSEEALLQLADQLIDAAADDHTLIDDLEALRLVLRHYCAYRGLRRGDEEPKEIVSLREAAIAENMQHLLDRLEGKPVLVLCGSWHATKILHEVWNRPYNEVQSWVQQLAKEGVSIYSLHVIGLSGLTGIGGSSLRFPVRCETDTFLFPDGESLSTILELAPQHEDIYIDLRVEENAGVRFRLCTVQGFNNETSVLVGELFDGIVFFKEATPIAQACP